MDGGTDIYLPMLLGRLGGVDLKMKTKPNSSEETSK